MPKAPSLREPLKNPVFRSICMANIVSNLGTFIQLVAASWLMATLTESSTMVSLIQSASSLPVAIFSFLAGAVADSVGRRKIMLFSQAFMFLASVVLAVLALTDHLSPWGLLACTFLIGCGKAFNAPAWTSAIKRILPLRSLTAAIALNSISTNAARSVGPAIGGAIVAVLGSAFAFIINAASYVWILIVLARLKPGKPKASVNFSTLLKNIGEGWAYVRDYASLRNCIIRCFVYSLLGASVTALMPMVTLRILDGNSSIYGVLLAAFGFGGIAAATMMSFLRFHFSTSDIANVSALICGLAIIVISAAENFAISLVAHFCVGVVWLLTIAGFNISIQVLAADAMQARSISFYYVAVFGGMVVGSAMWGQLADLIGVQNALMAIGILQMSTVGLSLIFPLPATREKDYEVEGEI